MMKFGVGDPIMNKNYERNYGAKNTLTRDKLIFLYGCNPSKTVDGKTNMIQDLINCFNMHYSEKSTQVCLPDCFNQVQC